MKCNKEKELSEFYTHPGMADGHLNKCVECTKKDVSQRYNSLKQDPEFVLAERKRTREKYWRLNYRDRHEVRGEQKSKIMKRYFENNPEKKEAKRITSNAIKRGRLERRPCEICQTTENVQAHHEDYNKPLEVTWLCAKHHYERHIYLREQKLKQVI